MPVRVAENLIVRAEAQLAAAESCACFRDLGRGAGAGSRTSRQRRSPEIAELIGAAAPPPRPSCNRGSTPSRRRAKPPWRPKPRGPRPPRRRVRRRASSSRCRCSSAAGRSGCMCGGPFSRCWRARSRSWMPIVRSERMSSPRMERTGDDAGMRWSVVSLHRRKPAGAAEPGGPRPRRAGGQAGVDRRRRRESRARADRHSAGHVGSHRRDGVAAIVPDCLG